MEEVKTGHMVRYCTNEKIRLEVEKHGYRRFSTSNDKKVNFMSDFVDEEAEEFLLPAWRIQAETG